MAKRKRLMAKRKRLTAKRKRLMANFFDTQSHFFAVRSRLFFLPWVFFFYREVFVFAASLFLFAVRLFFLPGVFFFLPWGFTFCREVNSFAVTVVGHRSRTGLDDRICELHWVAESLIDEFRLNYVSLWIVAKKKKIMRRLRQGIDTGDPEQLQIQWHFLRLVKSSGSGTRQWIEA